MVDQVMESCLFVKILGPWISAYLEDTLDLLIAKVALHLDDLCEGHLVAIVAVADGAAELAKENDEGHLVVERGVQERD